MAKKYKIILSALLVVLIAVAAVLITGVIDINTMTVKKDGENVFVTPTEFQILSALVRNSGVIVTRAILLENIWDEGGSFIDDNTLSVHVSRLREKVGAEHIVTVRGIGYRWEDILHMNG